MLIVTMVAALMVVMSVLVVIMIMVMVMTTPMMMLFSCPPRPQWWPRFPLSSKRQSGLGSTEPRQSPKPIRKTVAVLSQNYQPSPHMIKAKLDWIPFLQLLCPLLHLS